ncbi:CHAT domain-containing protein [Thauera sp. JM12B12]|uniref:CHAT domain-containing protein n=1 Tax=Thauera sp. JM12B12 TaxID=3142262 RepID=UPI0031F45C65
MKAAHERDGAPLKTHDALTRLASLRTRDPHNTSADTVAALQQVTDSLSPDANAEAWREAAALLASHLLECPQGDRSDNVERAQALYRRILAGAAPGPDPDAWLAATTGLANALFVHPAATPAAFDEAAALYRAAIDTQRAIDPAQLPPLLGNFATLLSLRRTGDIDAALDEAIACQTEAVGLVDAADPPAPRAVRARAHYTLARLYLQRRGGVRANNVDKAIRELHIALDQRPEHEDPVGRVRALRALALAYPEWSGAASPAAARELADAAQAEADAIEARNANAALRRQGWAAIARQASALDAELDALYHMPDADRMPWLLQQLAAHEGVLRQLGTDAPPALRAHWLGGAARLLGRLPSLGRWDRIDATHPVFAEGLAAAEASQQPRLVLAVARRWGEFAHEIGDFERAFAAYRAAADLGTEVFEDFADPTHRARELESMRGDALFAAYAAARTGRAAEALRLAELSRNRALADALRAAHLAADLFARGRSSEHARLLAALRQVQAGEDALRRARELSPEQEMATAVARLAAAFGVDPTLLHARRTDAGKDGPDPTAAEQARLRNALQQAYAALRQLLRTVGSNAGAGATAVDTEAIRTLARSIGCSLVYLMATIHGTAAVAALADGRLDVLLLDGLDSARARPLAHQLMDTDATLLGEDAASAQLDDALRDIDHALRMPLLAPLEDWLVQLGAAPSCLIPLGSLGILPLQIATSDGATFSLAPSAAALAVAAASSAGARVQPAGAIVLADPERAELPPLPFARAEARWIAHLHRQRGLAIEVHVGDQATLGRLLHNDTPARWLHLACHGHFAHADPLQSALLLAGNDSLQLADLLGARTTIAGARLATLSACFSAQAERRALPDETLGFPLALMLAGVGGVIGTTWAVNDAAAMLFNSRLYALLLDGATPAAAVAHARAWLREADARSLAAATIRIRATLHAEDGAADAELDSLHRHFRSVDPASRPFSAARYWGAFALTGA